MVVCALLPLFLPVTLTGQARTRKEAIEAARRHKMTRLWKETESPIVRRANDLIERGLLEGVTSGRGANGWQLVMGGMRSGQGMTVGLGYRRSDLFNDKLGFRTTFRGTPQLASLVDFELTFPKLKSERALLNVYAKYENSPQVDFYGKGPDSAKSDRTSYRLETRSVTAIAGYQLFRHLNAGVTTGLAGVHTGPGKRGGVPATDEIFDEESAAGLSQDTYFWMLGSFMYLDFRDWPTGPRSGGLYGMRFRQFSDRDLSRYSARQIDYEGQHYIPYFNKTRVIALRGVVTLTFENSGNTIPFYIQPKMGGNDSLRGFDRYRFYDKHALLLSAEHRWHSFSGLDMAIFVDAAKVASRKADLDLTDLRVTAGFGFRFKMRESYFMRIDFAGGQEGFRLMWTFNDIFGLKREGPLQF